MPTDYGPVAIWGVVVALGAATFGIRASFVPPAVFAALTLPAIVAPEGAVAIAGNERVVAGAVASAVAWYVDDILATIVAGMAVLWLLRFGL